MLIKIDASNLNELSKKMRRCVEDVSDINSAIKSRKQNMPSFIRSEYSIGIQLSDVSKDMDAIDEQIRYLSRVLDQLVADAEILLGNETQALAVDKDKQSNPGFWEGLWNRGAQVVTGTAEFVGGAVSFGADVVRGIGEFGYDMTGLTGDAFSGVFNWGAEKFGVLFDGAGNFLNQTGKFFGDIYDFWITDFDQHKDELMLILGASLGCGEALYKFAKLDFTGAYNSAAKAAYRITAVFATGKEREEWLSKDGEDGIKSLFGEDNKAAIDVYNILDAGRKTIDLPNNILEIGQGDFSATDALFDFGDSLSGDGSKDLIIDMVGISKPVINDSYDIYEDIKDIYEDIFNYE